MMECGGNGANLFWEVCRGLAGYRDKIRSDGGENRRRWTEKKALLDGDIITFDELQFQLNSPGSGLDSKVVLTDLIYHHFSSL